MRAHQQQPQLDPSADANLEAPAVDEEDASIGGRSLALLNREVSREDEHDVDEGVDVAEHGKNYEEKEMSGGGSVPSSRFGGDADLVAIMTGQKTYQKGDSGLAISKLQTALIDLGYRVRGGVDGSFGKGTVKAVKRFQRDAGIPRSGKFDLATFAELQRKFDTREPYIDNAERERGKPGTHRLEDYEKDAAFAAMVPARGVGGAPSSFTEDLPGKGKYGDRIKQFLKDEVAFLHKELFADKKDLRKDPAKNFHDWSVLEGPAAAGKQVTDALYGSYAKKGAMTHATDTLVDQWEDELAINATKAPDQLQDKARNKVWYLINSNADHISLDHGAVPSDTKEAEILTPIVEAFVDTDAEVQKILELDVGWEGAELAGEVYVQRYKKDTDLANRVQLWELFHTCIHEYIHTLKHEAFDTYASGLDDTRHNTLVEGFCDFFTDNVRAAMTIDEPLQTTIEGPYFKSGQSAPAGVRIGSYPSRQQAEQVVSVVGIKNAQEAYFKGKTKLIGDS